MNLKDCHNFDDFRKLAKKKLPSPIFHYIDGGSDDEVTLKRNTEAFNDCDLIPNVLADVGNIDLSTTVLGQKIDFPLFLSATANASPLPFTMAKELQQKLQKTWVQFLAHQLWQLLVWKKLEN